MSGNSNNEKSKQLGMPFGTASGRLRKMVIFHLLKKHNENFCFRCGSEIETVDKLSIEHKKPWLHESTDLFWDINNISFSHLSCNCSDARQTKEKHLVHGTTTGYSYGCRCKECKTVASYERQLHRMNAKQRMG